jgi:hypothetical protein
MIFYKETNTKSRRTVTLFVRYKIGISSLLSELTYTKTKFFSRCSRKCLWAISCVFLLFGPDGGGGKWLKEKRVGRCELWHAHRKQQKSHTPCVYIYVKNEKKIISWPKEEEMGIEPKCRDSRPPLSPVSFCPYLFRLCFCFCSHTSPDDLFRVTPKKNKKQHKKKWDSRVCVCILWLPQRHSRHCCVCT